MGKSATAASRKSPTARAHILTSALSLGATRAMSSGREKSKQSTERQSRMQKINMSTIDAHKLRLLVAVYESGSISKAAAEFDLNQSTVSHTLERLREAIGDPLFVKAGRGIEPTEALVSIIPRVRSILAEIEGLIVTGDYDPEAETDAFSLAISTPSLLPDMRALQRLIAEKAPSARLELKRLSSSEDLNAYLDPRRADVAIALAARTYSPVLNHSPYSTDRMVIYYDPECRDPVLTEDDYVNASHGVVDHGSGGRTVLQDDLKRLGLKRKINLTAPTSSMLGEFIRGTDLITTMPARMGEAVYGTLASCEPPFALSPLKYDLVWHRRMEHSGRNQWLRDRVLAARDVAHP